MRSRFFTENHEFLLDSPGWWVAHYMKFFKGEDVPPAESFGSELNELFPGGLWLRSDHLYEFPGGVFQGAAFYGYDTALQKPVSVWVDSTSTHLSRGEGSHDPRTNTLTIISDGVNPLTGDAEVVKHTKTLSKDRMEFRSSKPVEGGGEITLLKVEATRQGRARTRLDLGPFKAGDLKGFDHNFRSSHPLAQHNLLWRAEGLCDLDVVAHSDDAKAAPSFSRGFERNVLLGRKIWLVSDGKAVISEGNVFQYRLIVGYDPDKGAYVGAYADSDTPYRLLLEGQFDERRQSLELESQPVDRARYGERPDRINIDFRKDGLKTTVIDIDSDQLRRRVELSARPAKMPC